LIHATWIDAGWRAGWSVPRWRGAGQERLLWSRPWLWLAPRDLQASWLGWRFGTLLRSSRSFRDWWSRVGGGGERQVILLEFPDGAWDIPWELLVAPPGEKGAFGPRDPATICLARTAGRPSDSSPSAFDDQLRVAVFQGARSLNGGSPLDLDGEFGQLIQAWSRLEQCVRERVAKPVVFAATVSTLPEQLRQVRPQVFWYSGHAERDRKHGVRLILADEKRVSPVEFADLLKQSGEAPPYAVFWGCDTARGRGAANQPALFTALRAVGVLNMLAMQTQISDSAAVTMAEGLFRGLVHGQSFEQAAAAARAMLLESPLPRTFPLDWATPVVWSAGRPVAAIRWGDAADSPALYQLFARTALAASGTGEFLTSPTAAEQTLARAWTETRRLWILGDGAEHRFRWRRTLRAVLNVTGSSLIPVELGTESCALELQAWAERIRARLVPGDQFPLGVRDMLARIKRDPEMGWRALCALPGLHLAIACNRVPDEEWFWKPVRDIAGPVAVLCEKVPGEDSSWAIDRWDASGAEEAAIGEALQEAPRLGRAMGLLNAPLRATHLALAPTRSAVRAESWNSWPHRGVATAEVGGGVVLTTTARRHARELFLRTPEDQRAGHLDCLVLLKDPVEARKPERREQRIEHLLGAGLRDEAVVEAAQVLRDYDRADRPAAAALLLERLQRGKLIRGLTGHSKVIAAWAYCQLGLTPVAEFYLREEPPELPDRARRHALLAEIAKARGDRVECLRSLDDAIRVCEEALRGTANGAAPTTTYLRERLLVYRQDRARFLQYVEHQPREAALEYERLLEEAQEVLPDADLAYIYRNYGEAMRTLAEAGDASAWQKAEDLLRQARELTGQRTYGFLYPEVLYQLSRLAAKRGRREEAEKYLAGCRQAAVRAGHGLLLAIVDARQFWNRYDAAPFAWSIAGREWLLVSKALAAFPAHGWAVRTLLDGCIRLARILQDVDPAQALAELRAVWAELEARPTFDRGSDQRRIAVTLAGLCVLAQRSGQPDEGWWARLLAMPWAAAWLAGATSPEEVWDRFVNEGDR
jgi:hypothetical protein